MYSISYEDIWPRVTGLLEDNMVREIGQRTKEEMGRKERRSGVRREKEERREREERMVGEERELVELSWPWQLGELGRLSTGAGAGPGDSGPGRTECAVGSRQCAVGSSSRQ